MNAIVDYNNAIFEIQGQASKPYTGARCYYCTKPVYGSTGTKLPASCGAYPCPEFASRYKEPAAVAKPLMVAGLESIVEIPLVKTSHRIQRCWFCFLETPRIRVRLYMNRSLLWCTECLLANHGTLPEHRVAARTNVLISQYPGQISSSFRCPCPGCHTELQGSSLRKTEWRGETVLLCAQCESTGPTSP